MEKNNVSTTKKTNVTPFETRTKTVSCEAATVLGMRRNRGPAIDACLRHSHIIRLGPAEGPGVKASRTVREKSRGYIEGAVYKSSARILFLYDSLESRGNHVDRNEIREWDPTYPRRSEVERARERADDATAGHALQMLKAQGTCTCWPLGGN
ncbi:hypothetical protein M441DRAFT_87060 [Trichoderma asperellum CBS 433.97]|uniref:Uncharacterized protein n=1 Tax=Trichoderma asperellum (strain ATCC 204424 / CBS 433.97 / NBRC 101777) TaxID=1042311 RepID=A0A2T3ZGL6_TRIA4|nr:hypothetical protein M441DRAFT_87060 [Trichoderma asperellum CBS 433.97]PTB43947.1 hypothetical protein M441DRAFT_87060 [Trichoderma asperellum CBS 433.97]